MNVNELRQFLNTTMSMSHIYQPIVIRVLLENDGKASIRQIAKEFLAYDEAQVEYYIRIVKRWPKITLSKHKVIDTSVQGFFYLQLDLEKVTAGERSELIGICNERIRGFIDSYKGIIGDYRYNPEDLSSSSTRFLVLKLAKGKCALCGASVKDKPIDVDHIIPRSKGGSNDISNLQALCYECNRAKKNRDCQDFRNLFEFNYELNCSYCNPRAKIEFEYNTAYCLYLRTSPKSLHSLIIPRRHVLSLSDLPMTEVNDLFLLAKVIKNELSKSDKSIKGFHSEVKEGIIGGRDFSHIFLTITPENK